MTKGMWIDNAARGSKKRCASRLSTSVLCPEALLIVVFLTCDILCANVRCEGLFFCDAGAGLSLALALSDSWRGGSISALVQTRFMEKNVTLYALTIPNFSLARPQTRPSLVQTPSTRKKSGEPIGRVGFVERRAGEGCRGRTKKQQEELQIGQIQRAD